MENMKLVDATLDGTVTYEMTITPNFSNLNSMLRFQIVPHGRLIEV
jgi:acyl-coenzyme A thioesterase 13